MCDVEARRTNIYLDDWQLGLPRQLGAQRGEPVAGLIPSAVDEWLERQGARVASEDERQQRFTALLERGSAEALSRRVSGRAEVRWSHGGEHFVHATSDATGFVRELFAQHGDEITDLEVRRASLEDTYMALVHRKESDARPGAVVEFEEVAG